MPQTQRIIDANANRAREALRVLEEAARFIIEEPAIALDLKQQRHEFSQAVAALPGLIYHRDTPGDVGTHLTTPSEQARGSMHDIVASAGARLSEALRVIEEYAKLSANQPAWDRLSKTCERVRYRGYDLTQQLMTALGSGIEAQWRVCLLLTESLCTHQSWQDVLEQALAAGVDAVQVREKAMEGQSLLKRTKEVLAIADGRAAVIVNDRPDVAVLAGAQGVHLGQADLDPREARKLVGNDLIIGVSTSNLDQARQAKTSGADYCGVGPMFPTTTKHKPALAGPEYLRDYLGWGGLPHLAIGGVNPENIGELASLGCQGVAVSAAICSAENPGKAAETVISALDSAVTDTTGTA